MPQTEAGPGAGVQSDAHPVVPRWVERMLRIPLPMKLVGANALLLVAATATAVVVREHEMSTAPVIGVVSAAFLIALLANIALVMLAVRSMTMLERTVDTIWHGDLSARVPISLLADRRGARVGHMFNILLDGLLADRARARRLAVELIDAGDRERAAISRELHDSTAQSLAALVMQLSVVSQCAGDSAPAVLECRLTAARLLATATLEEVRLLAHTMHPRVLDDLGLIAALRRLAREASAHASLEGAGAHRELQVDVVAEEGIDERVPTAVASVLYRVAQEAVQNARRHAFAKRVEVRVWADGDSVLLEVSDDGIGFQPGAARSERTGMGLFTMQERVALVDGELHVHPQEGGGTTVVASVPLAAIAALR